MATHTNRLAHETSPYLLQHAHNPVDWYPWGPEALERAQKEDRPILLSIGYAACHWCHVMERESFENPEIARLMNESFVCIKVDREERPDLDDIYMTATVALSGSGGWPMTVFLTPDKQPFFAGTYFPPSDKYGRVGFPTLLKKIAELWREDRPSLLEQAAQLTAHVREQSELVAPMAVSLDVMKTFVASLAASFDARYGGFSEAPKFPASSTLSLLLRHHRRSSEPRALEMVKKTLDGMKNGGIYDHLGGGFARYSTDERWLVPHFEKMLYDNAQLASVYLEAYQATGDAEYRRVARETLDYIVREMQSDAGGYFSATDADSEGEEGKFFVWFPEEIDDVLGRDEAEAFCLYYDVTPGGNWEGKNVLNTPRTMDSVARELGVETSALAQKLELARAKLYEARKQRVPPLLDDKILTAWNGLMVSAMADGYRVLRDPKYLESAERAALFVLENMVRPDGGLFRTARAGKAHIAAYLEDYAFLADGLIALYEASGKSRFLKDAERLLERMLTDFRDSESLAFYNTARDHEELLVRAREGNDSAIPSGNAVAARALARLSQHLGREDLRESARSAIRAYGRLIERSPRSFATSLSVVDFLLEPPLELVLVGKRGSEDYEALCRTVGERYLPNRIEAHVDPTAERTETPLTEGKTLVKGASAAYVCRNFTCEAPVTLASELTSKLDAVKPQTVASEVSRKKLEGSATPEGTQRFAERCGLPPSGYSELGTTGLKVSRLGFGGYRVSELALEHRSALEQALKTGVNLLDTSTNYTDGQSERAFGEVIAKLARAGELVRDEIVLVSKIGYVQSKNLELAMEREGQGKPFPEMVKYGDNVWHCIHPEWLEDQLTRSLNRLGVETLDVCLLHNPEYFFSDAIKRGRGPIDQLRTEFYERVSAAFAKFEEEVKRGRVRYYGVSSNTLIAKASSREATSLAAFLECARKAGGNNHHFRVAQVPMNLLEAGAMSEHNTGPDQRLTVLEQAQREQIAVLINRPLNAIVGGGISRLSDPASVPHEREFPEALHSVVELEQEFRNSLAPILKMADGSSQASELFNWGEQLKDMPARVESLVQWQEIETSVIAPQVSQVLRALDRALVDGLQAKWQDFRGRYVKALDELLNAIRAKAAERSRGFTSRIHQALAAHLPEERQGESLSRKTLWVLSSVPGVTCVLVGARRPAYVEDLSTVLRWPELTTPREAVLACASAAGEK